MLNWLFGASAEKLVAKKIKSLNLTMNYSKVKKVERV